MTGTKIQISILEIKFLEIQIQKILIKFQSFTSLPKNFTVKLFILSLHYIITSNATKCATA